MSDRGGRCRVFFAEDEPLVAMLVEDMLVEIGCDVASFALTGDDALRMAREAEFDVAVLDVNLDGETSYPAAEALRARGIPFIFATSYGVRGMNPAFADVPVLQKPFRKEDLARLLKGIRAR